MCNYYEMRNFSVVYSVFSKLFTFNIKICDVDFDAVHLKVRSIAFYNDHIMWMIV